MSKEPIITTMDAKKFLTDPSTGNRVEMAEKLGVQMALGKLSKEERTIAEDIFRLMVKDAEVRVRKALSDSLKDSPNLPHDVAAALAKDVNEISLPIIECSVVLGDEDLIHIIESRGASAQSAVARRKQVSSVVSEALVATDNVDVIATLVGNDGADLSVKTMGKVLDKYGENEKINAPLAQRGNLPIEVSERLVNLVSESIREHLVTHHELSADVAMDILLASRERATISLLEPGNNNLDVKGLVNQLHIHNRLTSTIILRALFMGDIVFFETALAKKAGIPSANVYQLVHDKGDKPIEKLFIKANMPLKSIPMVRKAIAILQETMATNGDDRVDFQHKMVERLLTQMEDEFDGEHVDYFLSKLA